MTIGRTERPQARNAVAEPDRLMSQLASSVEIYWISGSPFAWRVLLTAEVKGIPYEEKLLQASKGELKATNFLAINPLGRVPALRDAAPGSPRAADGRSVSACGPALRRAPVGPCVIERMEARALAADRRKDVERVPRGHGCGCRSFAANAVRLSFMRCLQPRQFSADAGDAGPDQRLVADEPAGKTHQDWREGLSHGRYVAFHWA
jgi:hypothetical protein